MSYICCNSFDSKENRSLICRVEIRWNKVGLEHTKIGNFGMKFVEIWSIYIPKQRILECEIHIGCICGIRIDLHFLFSAENDFITSVFCEKYFYQGNLIFQSFVLQFNFCMKRSVDRIAGYIIFNLFRITKDSIRCNVKFWHVAQFNTAENSGAGVPAGIWLHARVDCDSDSVRFSEIDVRRDIYGKWDISVVLKSRFTTINIDSCIHHNPVKMQINNIFAPFLWDFNLFCIICNAFCIIAACRTGSSILSDFTFNHVIVWKIYFPDGICFFRVRESAIESVLELPALIDILITHG